MHAGLAAGPIVALLFGCSMPPPLDAGDSAPDEAAESAEDDATEPDAAEPDAGGPNADPEASVCNDAVVLAAGETIDSQLEALGEADFDRALSFASRRFQAEVDPENFAAIIASQYPILLDDAEAEFGRCAQVEDLARMEATVIGTDGARDVLVYLLVREEGRWSIDGAASIDEGPRELI